MAKKIVLMFIVFSAISGAVIAQEQERATHSVAASFGFIGASLSYERMFSRHFSVLAEVSYTTLVLIEEFTLSGKGRWYPFGRAFYLELGFGLSYGRGISDLMTHMLLGLFTFGWYFTTLDEDDLMARRLGLLVQPGMGWKIDIGRPGGFVLPVSMGLNFKLGRLPDVLPFLRVGLGYSF